MKVEWPAAVAANDHGRPWVKIEPKCPAGREFRRPTAQRKCLSKNSPAVGEQHIVCTARDESSTQYPCAATRLPTSKSSAAKSTRDSNPPISRKRSRVMAIVEPKPNLTPSSFRATSTPGKKLAVRLIASSSDHKRGSASPTYMQVTTPTRGSRRGETTLLR